MSIEMIEDISSADELQRAAIQYNWNDGFRLPVAIANHPQCDLAVALELFWLSDSISWYTKERELNSYNRDWAEFCELITERILSGFYHHGPDSFNNELSRSLLGKYKKQNVPDILLNNI